MKKWLSLLLLFLALIAMGAAFLQSGFLHRISLETLSQSAEKSGWKVKVEKSRGILPLFFTWENVTLSGHGVHIQIDQIEGEIAPLGLFKGPLRLTKLQVGKANITLESSSLQEEQPQKTPLFFPFDLRNVHIQKICMEEKCLDNIKGSFQWTQDKIKTKASFFWRGEKFAWDGYLKREKEGRLWVDSPFGKNTFEITPSKEGLNVQGDGVTLTLFLPRFSLHAASFQVEGTFDLQTGISADFAIGNFQEFKTDLYGSAHGKIKGNWNDMELQGEGTNLYWGPFSCKTLLFSFDPKKSIDFQAISFSWKKLHLTHASFLALKEETDWEFLTEGEGRWHHPLKVKAFGKVDSDLKGQIETGFGTFYNHTFLLKDPCPFSFSEVGPLALSFDQGTLLCKWDYRDEKSDFTLSFSNFPLDLLSLNPLEVPITGEITSELSLHQEKRVLTGQWKALLSGFQAGTIQTSGNVTGDLEKERLLLSGHLGREGKEEIGMELSLPIRILLSPPQIEIFWNDSLTGQFFYDGNVEELLDFADLGTHHISGNCNCNLTLSDTLLHPSLKGICTFTNGLYENYLTGVKLTAIEGKGEALGDRIDIAITGRDLPSLGTFEGTGVIELKTEEKFPFLFHAQLQDFAVTQIDLVSSKATGNFTLVGNWEGAHLEGNVDLLQTELHIPSHLPNPLPELTVVYRNALKPPPIPPEKGNFIYPIALDLSLQTIHGIRIDGRGLTSEWNGAFHLGGTSANFIAEGKLDLIEGEFLFAGRSFKLTDGALSFRGKPNEVPYLNLGGLVQVKDVEISVRLKGPLNRPQVTFQSSPPLPMSSIVSYLLFGQEIAEINSFQALQLVGTIASFSGDAPDVLEETRRALGVDRLEIVSMPGPGEEEALTNTVAVQVGKYVGESVLVSYTQGAEFAAGNISIEIEIPHGLTIMLENDQKMEQGKFTLKWNYNY